MKPVTLSNIHEHVPHDDTVLGEQPLMLLQENLLGVRYLRQFLSRNVTNIKTNGGLTLPLEVWDMIIKFAVVDRRVATKTSGLFTLVQGLSLQSLSGGHLLRCQKVEIICSPVFPDLLDCGNAVREAESFMNKPKDCDSEEATVAMRFTPGLTPHTLDILFTDRDDSLPAYLTCLFTKIEVPDVIAFVKGGYCCLCERARFVCVSCTEDWADVNTPLQGDWGCGCYVRVCPLCPGLDLSAEHMAFLDKECLAPLLTTETERKYWDDRIRDRILELGYRRAEVEEARLKSISRHD